VRRAPRGSARKLSLAVAGALLFVVGYFAGSRYTSGPLQDLGLVLLPEPQALAGLADGPLPQRWQLLLVGDPAAPECRRQLAWLARVHNRLAQRVDFAEHLGVALVTTSAGTPDPAAHRSGWQIETLPRDAALTLTRALGAPPHSALDCRGHAPALIDPQRRLRALLPSDLAPETVAADLERLLDHYDIEVDDPMSENSAPGLLDRLNTLALRVLPQHLLADGMYHLARSTWAPLKDLLIRFVVRRYGVDLNEAEQPDPAAYPSFNAFFTRALRTGVRPIDPDATALVSPADGRVSQAGDIRDGRLLQAKGHDFSLEALLAGDRTLAAEFQDGRFATVYLSPRDYHRVHMPLAGTLRRMDFVPGDLFSVSDATTQLVPGLFARNERVISVFDTPDGPLGLVLVGAIFVGSMETVWAGEVRVAGNTPTRWTYSGDQAPVLAKGQEMGRFNMGSTVILLLPRDSVDWHDLTPGRAVRMGERIGTLKG
jgi:phosphatidylserine decarboxylase